MREFSRTDAFIPLGVRLISDNERDKIKSRISGDITFTTTRPVEEPADKVVGEWLKLINQKIDFLISLITMEQQGFSSLPVNKVNISGGGLCFLSEKSYNIGDILELKMVIENPAPLALFVYGEVVNSEKTDNGFRVGVKFVNIDEDVRDQIVKFVFHRQRQILRQKREF